MFRLSTLLLAAAALTLTACGSEPAPKSEVAAAAQAPEAAYTASPMAREARLEGAGLVLAGVAAPGAEVRLAAPTGEAVTAKAGQDGRWRIALPAPAAAQVFGLSATGGGRTVQSQGYVLIAPGGRAAVLRGGAGAVRLDPRSGPAIETFDFDREGGAVVTGRAPPNALIDLRLNGRQAAEGRSDGAGRFEISLPQPVASGRHRLEVEGDGFTSETTVSVSPPADLDAGPLRAQPTAEGLRADWLTPGGGVQSTLILG